MIHRRSGFLTVVWFGSTPTSFPPLLLSCLSFSVFPVYCGSSLLMGEGGGWVWSQIIQPQETLTLYSISRSIFSAFNYQPRWSLGGRQNPSRVKVFCSHYFSLLLTMVGIHIWCYKVHGSFSVFFLKKPPSPVRKRSRDGQGLLKLCQVLGSLGHTAAK